MTPRTARRAPRVLGLALLSALAFAQAPTPPPAHAPDPATQQPASSDPITTLKVSTRVVEVSAVVLSKSGEPAGGLTRDDFVLKEDGHDEPIHYFSQGSELPLTLALLVDTSGSQRTFINDESLAADVFFETMLEPSESGTPARAPNRAMLVQFDTQLHQLSPMTTSAGALHLALGRLGPDTSTHGGTLLDDAVYAVARGPLAHETGRKAIVILSDGGDNGSRASLTQAIEEAQRGNTQIFSIRYSAWNGLSGAPGGFSGASSGLSGASGGFSGPASSHSADPGVGILQKLSESTGGRVFNVTRSQSLRTIFAQIAADLRLEYELGYTPPPDLAPNSYHKLEVRTRDRALTVQARKGFFAQP